MSKRILFAALLLIFAAPLRAENVPPTPTAATTGAAPAAVAASTAGTAPAPTASPATQDASAASTGTDTTSATGDVAPTGTSTADTAAPTAQDSVYIKPTLNDLINTVVGLKALDLTRDDVLLDEYAIVTNCDLYDSYHNDEFKWRHVREILAAQIKKNAQHFARAYYYDTVLQLGKYDFEAKLFRFAPRAGIENINALMMHTQRKDSCGAAPVMNIPTTYRVTLKIPVYVHGIPMSADEGELLLQKFDVLKNPSRLIYARFNVRVNYIEPLAKNLARSANKQQQALIPYYVQPSTRQIGAARMESDLDSIDFFLDADHKIKLYTFIP